MNSREQIGTQIVALRKAGRLSQQQVADAAGLSRPGLANIEAGRQGLLIETLAPIAAAVGTTVSALLGEAPAPAVPLALLTKVAGAQREATKLMTELADILHSLAAASERLEALLERSAAVEGTRREGLINVEE